MLNKIKVKNYELWDAETGEADVIAVFDNNIELKAFTLDHFDINENTEVIVSLFCQSFEIKEQPVVSSIVNDDNEFHAKVNGKIIGFKTDEEEGDILTVDAGGIVVSVYVPFEEVAMKNGDNYFSGYGRLDIETEMIS